MATDRRTVLAIEAANILPDAVFVSEVIPSRQPVSERRQARQDWFASTLQKLAGSTLVFVDPDNGLEPDGYRPSSGKAGKSISSFKN